MSEKMMNPLDGKTGFAFAKIELCKMQNGNCTNVISMLNAVIDTGAEYTNVNEKFITHLDALDLNRTLHEIKMGDARKTTPMKMYGACFKMCDIEMESKYLEFVSNPNLPNGIDVILGAPELRHFKFTYHGNLQLFELEFLKDKA